MNTLPREESLKSRKLISELFSAGKSLSEFPVKLVYKFVEHQERPALVTFSVSKKRFKRAVDRNRVKRLMREAYRKNKSNLLDSLIIKEKQVILMFIYGGKEILEYKLIEEKIIKLLKRLAV